MTDQPINRIPNRNNCRRPLIDLKRARVRYGQNIGCLDYLISLEEARQQTHNIIQSHPRNISPCNVAFKQHQELMELAKKISSTVAAEEYDFLLVIAGKIIKLNGVETYIEIIRYLTLKYRHLSPDTQELLIPHISNALRISEDKVIAQIVRTQKLIDPFSLPMSNSLISKIFEQPLSSADKTRGDGRFFNFENCMSTTTLRSAMKGVLSCGALSGIDSHNDLLLACNAVTTDDEFKYLCFLNEYLKRFKLAHLKYIDFSSCNLLNSFKFCAVTPEINGPLVSVIMSMYNSENTVDYALNSICNQSYKNIEVLVCDDGSSDHTLELAVRAAKSDSRVRVFRSVGNQGTYNIRNNLIKHSGGEFITFADSDDISHPQRISSQVAAILSDPHVVMCNTQWLRLNSQGQFVFSHDNLALRFCVVSSMISRSVFENIGPFRPSSVASDTDFYERVRGTYGISSCYLLGKPLLFGLSENGSLTMSAGTLATSSGYLSKARRAYSDITFRQRALGSAIISEAFIINELKKHNIFRADQGVEEL